MRDVWPMGDFDDWFKNKYASMKYYSILLLLIMLSCTSEMDMFPDDGMDEIPVDSMEIERCHLDSLYGSYSYRTDDKEVNSLITFKEDSLLSFTSFGIDGLWYPAVTFEGNIIDCEIFIRGFTDVMIQGLNSPGGATRYYYDSLSGTGEYFPEEDSMAIYIDFLRTGDFGITEFKGNIYLTKVD